jgi:hypothetical protein
LHHKNIPQPVTKTCGPINRPLLPKRFPHWSCLHLIVRACSISCFAAALASLLADLRRRGVKKTT